MVTREYLLEEAKRRYPIGSEIICVGNKKHCLVKMKPYFYCSEDSLAGAASECILYQKEKWAEIVSLPYEKQIELW